MTPRSCDHGLEAGVGIEPAYTALQAPALPDRTEC